MNFLFIHCNYPGQFGWIAEALGRQSQHKVRFLTARRDAGQFPLEGVHLEYFDDVDEHDSGLSTLTLATDACIRRGEIIHDRIGELGRQGFIPHVVLFHGGNGISLFLKTILPGCVSVGYFEWYFNHENVSLLTGRNDNIGRNALTARNIPILQELVSCDVAVTPTHWQAQQFPLCMRAKLDIIFDGIDPQVSQNINNITRTSKVVIRGESGMMVLNNNELLLTYATRGMEPMRGFLEFMRAMPSLLCRNPSLKVLIAGRDRSAYGAPAPTHQGSWKAFALEELGHFNGFDRLRFTGLLPRHEYITMLHRTNLHCYFSREYVPSWSFFEAIAAGAKIITNDGPTTSGVIDPQSLYHVNLDSSPEAIADIMNEALHNDLPKYSPPGWIFRSQSIAHWELLLNRALAQQRVG